MARTAEISQLNKRILNNVFCECTVTKEVKLVNKISIYHLGLVIDPFLGMLALDCNKITLQTVITLIYHLTFIIL